jgi:predicted metalloprotease with PDZ domain
MRYDISIDSELPHLFSIRLCIPNPPGRFTLKLPRWRPGRYSYADFAAYVNDFEVVDSKKSSQPGQAIIQRVDPYQWEIRCAEGLDELHIQYHFFPNKADAGGSFFDTDLFLLNPINCLLYSSDLDETSISLSLPDHYQYYSQLRQATPGHFIASDYQELADSPIIGHAASASAVIDTISDKDLQIRFVQVCYPGQSPVPLNMADLKPVMDAQVSMFGDCPVSTYDFLFFPSKKPIRHGVEHEATSLLVMGPPESFTKESFQKSLLELASHEFYHTWNVKCFRPEVFYPYTFDKLPSSPLHYITEGVTTYYGDLMIWKAGTWDIVRWVESINGELRRLYSSPAHLHTSLREASLLSDINGYRDEGLPFRRISFYNKGYLVAMLLDHEIRNRSNQKHSLDDVMRQLYTDFGKGKKGYSEEDFWNIVGDLAPGSWADFFGKYLDGTADMLPALKAIGQQTGLHLKKVPPEDSLTYRYGLICTPSLSSDKEVAYVYPESPAAKAGILPGDVVTVKEGPQLRVKRGKQVLDVALKQHDYRLGIPQFVVAPEPEAEQLKAREDWRSI